MGIRPSMQAAMRVKIFEQQPPGLSVVELGDQYAGNQSGRILARELYVQWKASRYVSIDGNGLGDYLHDLNQPLPREFWDQNERFDVVTDFGTGEHIWDQSRVWETMHNLCRPGGWIVFDRPMQGYIGHCFYLTLPAVIAGLVHANDYRVLWSGRERTSRGELIRGILQRTRKGGFVMPQQGRYYAHLKIRNPAGASGPDWKNEMLRDYGFAGKKLPHMHKGNSGMSEEEALEGESLTEEAEMQRLRDENNKLRLLLGSKAP